MADVGKTETTGFLNSPKAATTPAPPKTPDANNDQKPEPEPAQQPAGILPASHWSAISDEPNDADSTFSEDISTTSLTSSILEYRTLHGRTFHREIGQAEAWEPNDERHAESMDLHHHMCQLMLDGKLFLVPVEPERIKGPSDFGDAYPSAAVTGTDLSPIQPSWVPPNVKFEIDDANLDWTWDDNTFDFIHVRFLAGNIADWSRFYREAFRCCTPGGWIEHQDPSFVWHSDRGIPEDSALDQFPKVFWAGGEKFGRSFRVVEDELQRKGLEAAGFVDVVVRDVHVPVGDWPTDPHQKELGTFAQVSLLSDIEGYLVYMFNVVMGWTKTETQVYCAHLRRQLRDPELHPYFTRRIVYARKPE
ncbi:hypothetical protein NEMBOFW57_007808 [Staphylotrichum longicolle]|uniref:Uncharacterized protein n=1 Tax=Staphylotrichum longicolle TaxID=669026 RepID=A0AAD4EYW9_9PEZI|nr:hypothetical protein NEMBOFW57_007808 [Staphylotrichum longicolle]